MLIMGETPASRKAFIWSCITTDRELVKTMTALNADGLLDEALSLTRDNIKRSFQELIDLKRWQRTAGYEDGQPYKPPSLIAYEKKLEEDGELDDYMEHKATLQAEIDRLEYEYSLKRKDGENG